MNVPSHYWSSMDVTGMRIVCVNEQKAKMTGPPVGFYWYVEYRIYIFNSFMSHLSFAFDSHKISFSCSSTFINRLCCSFVHRKCWSFMSQQFFTLLYPSYMRFNICTISLFLIDQFVSDSASLFREGPNLDCVTACDTAPHGARHRKATTMYRTRGWCARGPRCPADHPGRATHRLIANVLKEEETILE